MGVVPLIKPGWEGMLILVTERLCAVPVPQTFTPETKTDPLLAEAVVEMLAVDEVPDQPDGKVHK